MGEIQGCANAGVHHRAALALALAHIVDGLADVVWGGEGGIAAPLGGAVVELDDLERVARLHVFQRPLDGRLGLLDGLAVHAAGAVQNEDHLHGLAREGGEVLRGIEHQG